MSDEDVELVYSDDDDCLEDLTAFTKQLAALGIDEQAELSEGECDMDFDAPPPPTGNGAAADTSGARPRSASPPQLPAGAAPELSPFTKSGGSSTSSTHHAPAASVAAAAALGASTHSTQESSVQRAAAAASAQRAATLRPAATPPSMDAPLRSKRPRGSSAGRTRQHGSGPRSQPPPDSGADYAALARAGKRRRPFGGGSALPRRMTVSEAALWLCERLAEPKYLLMCQVAWHLGFNRTRMLLKDTLGVQAAGGMPTADGKRMRTPGGVFLTLLREAVPADTLKKIYAEDKKFQKERERAKRAQRAAKRRKAVDATAAEPGEVVEGGGGGEAMAVA